MFVKRLRAKVTLFPRARPPAYELNIQNSSKSHRPMTKRSSKQLLRYVTYTYSMYEVVTLGKSSDTGG